MRVLETTHPPTYYVPLKDINTAGGVALEPTGGGSFCEWKGRASYFDLVVKGKRSAGAAWARVPCDGAESRGGTEEDRPPLSRSLSLALSLSMYLYLILAHSFPCSAARPTQTQHRKSIRSRSARPPQQDTTSLRPSLRVALSPLQAHGWSNYGSGQETGVGGSFAPLANMVA